METMAASTDGQVIQPRISPYGGTWSARRARDKTDEKRLMAEDYAQHGFLVREGMSPETAPRETVASILVNQGTTPNVVVRVALEWIEENQGFELSNTTFDITWYTPGHLVPNTLREFRERSPHLSAATQLFLFPGKVDPQTESVSGPDAEIFAENLRRHFTYAFLSAYAFDIHTGMVYFHLPEEVRLQKACATRYAAHKLLFLDSSKFKSEGEVGYGIDDLLRSAESVTIYTVSSSPNNDEWIKMKFRVLCNDILEVRQETSITALAGGDERDMKSLRLHIVGPGGTVPDSSEGKGFLRDIKCN